MLIVTIKVNAPGRDAMGVKEDLAYLLEAYGDIISVDVAEIREVEQLHFDGR